MVEYCVLITVVVAAFIGMQVYLKRAVCGRWKSNADTFGFGRQFDPVSTVITAGE